MEKKLILPSLRQTPEIKQFSPKEYIENKTIRSSKNVDFRHQNIDKRRTPSPLTGISPIIAANSIFQSPLSYKIKKSDFSNEKIKSKQKNIISFYTLTRKKKIKFYTKYCHNIYSSLR